MGLLDIIEKELIIVPLTATDRNGIIESLVDRYASSRNLSDERRREIVAAVLERESMGSTAMERGIAIPHVKLAGMESPSVVIGVSRLPVDFGGAEKSSIFFLVLAGDDNPSEFIQILASITRLCSSDMMVRMIKNARNADEVHQLFFD